MKLKELIDKYEAVECVVGIVSGKTILKTVLRDLKQLDEPEKVKVPQFVAGWIENCKRGLSLRQAISQIHVGIELDDWLMEVDADGAFANQETFARAWLDGYEVKEEKRYTVVMKETKQPLYYNAGDKKLFFSLGGIATNFTRKQLEEAGFRWVFDCPGIEIEEVE